MRTNRNSDILRVDKIMLLRAPSCSCVCHKLYPLFTHLMRINPFLVCVLRCINSIPLSIDNKEFVVDCTMLRFKRFFSLSCIMFFFVIHSFILFVFVFFAFCFYLICCEIFSWRRGCSILNVVIFSQKCNSHVAMFLP